jgi:hypothetical protein
VRVVLLSDGVEHACTTLGPSAAFVEVRGIACPVCGSRAALRDAGGTIRALARPAALGLALEETEREWGPCEVERGPAPFRVRAPRFSIEAHVLRGAAICGRCDSAVGTLIVRFGSLFGLDEDARVERGPWKVF